ncbi:MAG TPA: hypothetical protein VGR35_13170 [Tepidisphaeraceae bacterium]|nr:hypothetical protein [Tepidisphaeraceae bacterium]
MKKALLIGGVAGVLAVGGCRGKGGEDRDHNEMTISLSEVPPAVRASFEKMHPNATVHQVEKETRADGMAAYEFEFTQDGRKREVELDHTGALVPEDRD